MAASLAATAAKAPVGAPVPFMAGVVSTASNEYNLSVSDDGRLMVFARSQARFADARIMVMHLRNGRWSSPSPITFTDPRYSDSDPWVTPDGRWLYFVSDRPAPGRDGVRRDRDVWRVARTPAGAWGRPEHLAEVSSPAEDLGPELHGRTLYFNSSRPGGSGGLDIHASALGADGRFLAPVALGAPINSAAGEGDFTLSRDGARAFFWSTRDGDGALYSARRTRDGWSIPTRLSAGVNDGGFTFTPTLSRDGGTLTYASTRRHAGQPEGMADIYTTPAP
jgi:hypothetical protein